MHFPKVLCIVLPGYDRRQFCPTPVSTEQARWEKSIRPRFYKLRHAWNRLPMSIPGVPRSILYGSSHLSRHLRFRGG